MIKAQIKALETPTGAPDNIPTFWTTPMGQTTKKTTSCKIMEASEENSGSAGIKVQTAHEWLTLRPPPRHTFGEICGGSWAVICPKSIENYRNMDKPNLFCNKVLEKYAKILDEGVYNFDTSIGSGAGIIIHELTYFPNVCITVPNWLNGNAVGNRPRS
jgi:hypothetical protein